MRPLAWLQPQAARLQVQAPGGQWTGAGLVLGGHQALPCQLDPKAMGEAGRPQGPSCYPPVTRCGQMPSLCRADGPSRNGLVLADKGRRCSADGNAGQAGGAGAVEGAQSGEGDERAPPSLPPPPESGTPAGSSRRGECSGPSAVCCPCADARTALCLGDGGMSATCPGAGKGLPECACLFTTG